MTTESDAEARTEAARRLSEAIDSLTPTQRRVYGILYGAPQGACRRDFAQFDVWEVSNRISEIEDRLRITITRDRCVKHDHRNRVVRYSL